MALGMADSRQHRPVRHEFIIDPKLLVNGLQERHLIVIVVDSELTRKPGPDFGQGNRRHGAACGRKTSGTSKRTEFRLRRYRPAGC